VPLGSTTTLPAASQQKEADIINKLPHRTWLQEAKGFGKRETKVISKSACETKPSLKGR